VLLCGCRQELRPEAAERRGGDRWPAGRRGGDRWACWAAGSAPKHIAPSTRAH